MDEAWFMPDEAERHKRTWMAFGARPTTIRETDATDEFAAGYIGFYVCNAAVIMQDVGDAQADLAARQALQKAFPDRVIEQVAIDGIAAGGGSIHCATQQEPAA